MSPLRNSRPVRATAAWLCAALSVGCTAAQVRPMPGDCPQEAFRSMEELNLTGKDVHVVLDIHQPGQRGHGGIYPPGPIVSRVELLGLSNTSPLPEGTLLYGQLWTEGLTKRGKEAVYGRWTEALLPDGRRVPVCYVIVTTGGSGLYSKREGSKPGQAIMNRVQTLKAVDIWP